MKNILLIIAGIVVLFALAFGYDMYAGPQFVPVSSNNEANVDNVSLGMVPDFIFKGIDGKELSIDALRGKVVIINFWATWCPTCLVELPDMLGITKNFDGDVILLAISSDKKLGDIERFIEKQSDDIKAIVNSDAVHIVLDEDRMITHDLFLTELYPETIIISPKGEMIRKIVGYFDWKSDKIREYLAKLF